MKPSIYNLKRRIASLPSVPFEVFTVQVVAAKSDEAVRCSICQSSYGTSKAFQTHLKSRSHTENSRNCNQNDVFMEGDGIQRLATVASQMENLELSDGSSSEDELKLESKGESNDDVEDDTSNYHEGSCIFCLYASEDLEEDISHMKISHGFFIPNIDTLTHASSFIAYLHALITRFHECLDCGRVLASAEAARDHMKDKGHCRVNLDGEEFRGFWEERQDEEDVMKAKEKLQLEADKLALPGGRVLHHRKHREIRTQKQAQITDSTTASQDETSNADRRLAVSNRRELGVVGLSDVQRRGLRAVEKKMIKVEMRARNGYRAVMEKKANKQKFFRPDGPGHPNGGQ